MHPIRSVLILLMGTTLAAAALAQSPRAFTADDYARAEKFMAYNTTPLVFRTVRAMWIGDSQRFWYRNLTGEGSEFIVFDAAKGARQPAFDHAKLAAALGTAARGQFDPRHLPFEQIEVSPHRQSISLALRGRRLTCDAQGHQWTSAQAGWR